MKTSIAIAALVISGAVFIGCDKKDTTTVTSPDGKTTTTVTTPATPTTPDTSKVGSALDKAVDKGADSVKNGADKLLGGAPTTAPSLPTLPK